VGAIAWTVLGAVLWMVAAVPVALVVGAVLRRRGDQVPVVGSDVGEPAPSEGQQEGAGDGARTCCARHPLL
jgi:hypothetical protein